MVLFPHGYSNPLLLSLLISFLPHIQTLYIFGLVPLEWKTSSVLPIRKSSPASSSPFDYPPISLLSLASELLENYNLLAV